MRPVIRKQKRRDLLIFRNMKEKKSGADFCCKRLCRGVTLLLLKQRRFPRCNITAMDPVLSPDNKRIYVVDALRGFAVMAIMLLHFLEHFIYNSYPVASSPVMEAANQQFKEVFFFLFAGKSYTIFALLFGFTFAIQYRNQARKGRDFAGRFVWRMCLLVVFACLNAMFFPGGDVLLTFAIAGLLLVPCRRLKTSALVLLSLFFLAQPLEWAYAAAQWMNPGWAPPSLSVAESYASLKAAVDTGNFWVMARENLTVGQWASLAWGIEAGRLMQAPGLFLLGFVLGRQDFFLQNDGNAVFWTRGLLLSLAGAVAFYVVMSLPGLPAPLHTVFSMWHNVCFTGLWVAGFVLLYRLEYFRKMTVPLLTYGRMSLTNYVSQSMIGSLIFFPYALGLAPYCGYLASFVIGCAAMAGQIWFCRWWLERHRYGVLEGWWHRATWMDAGKAAKREAR